jgi:hypothetical protein
MQHQFPLPKTLLPALAALLPPPLALAQNMTQDSIAVQAVVVTDSRQRSATGQSIDPSIIENISGNASHFENILKVLPGVQSGNELSSQYSVRGGSYDENMTILNGVEMLRPMLAKSGQQEGMSAINGQLVSRTEFWAGGFGAEYGSKMSSVLNVQYKRPLSSGGSADAGMLGGSASGYFIGTERRWSGIAGARYRRTDYLLGTLDEGGDYKPLFYDAQALLHWDISPKWSMHFFGIYAHNRYEFFPSDRKTTFSTFAPIKFWTYNQGSIYSRYTNGMGSISADYALGHDLKLKFMLWANLLYEQESLDILSEYLLTWASNQQDRNDYDIGALRQHSRIDVRTHLYQAWHGGQWRNALGTLQWGLGAQVYRIYDDIYMWQTLDSAGYMYPRSADKLEMRTAAADYVFDNQKYSAHAQQPFDIELEHGGSIQIIAGARLDYTSANEELLLQPRVQAVYYPSSGRQVKYYAAAGLYGQPPFYKELKDANSVLHPRRRAQKSAHALAGVSAVFEALGAPCRFTGEAYYKYLYDIIPYTRDNVGIAYYPHLSERGGIYGLDMKLNGELTPGAESWISVSLMRARRQAAGGASLPMPSDQLFNASLMLEDRVLDNAHWRAHVLFHYGSAVPVYVPLGDGLDRYIRMPAYSRADMGLTFVFWDEFMAGYGRRWGMRALSLTLEVLNVFDVRNVSSYLWVPTIVNGGMQTIAVPNYLTPRLLNISVKGKF